MAEKISKEQVEHIADLARIGLQDEEKIKLQEDLGSVLDYVDKLQQVDVSGVDPITNISGALNQTREDENGSSKILAENLFSMAPDTKDGYVKVRQVLAKIKHDHRNRH
jgi:aspartyl-tRNA(Asn)/glutamyl-tRNA(Gln) amidotransferase subunit C